MIASIHHEEKGKMIASIHHEETCMIFRPSIHHEQRCRKHDCERYRPGEESAMNNLAVLCVTMQKRAR